MVALVIIGFCVIPIVINILFVYLCFKQENEGHEVTVEDLVIYLDEVDEFHFPVMFMVIPGASMIVTLVILMYILTYPLRVLCLKFYEKIRHMKI